MSNNVLDVNHLVTELHTSEGKFSAVRDVSFSVNEGETLCVVGESGSGKSITALSIMDLLPHNGNIASGNIYLNGENITKAKLKRMQKIRGNALSMIFQEPMTALNPVFTIGFQLREPLFIHKSLSKKEAHKKAIDLLKQVGIPLPEKRMSQFPHELSGGMLQRVMISMALACDPQVLIADEPTTALDVTIQDQILDLIQELKVTFNTGVIFITHDMSVVAEIADRVMVMYAGKVVEQGNVKEVFNHPKHPYTEALLKSIPDIEKSDAKMTPIPGSAPQINEKIAGCCFHPGCQYSMEKCKVHEPDNFKVGETQFTECWLYENRDNSKRNAKKTHMS